MTTEENSARHTVREGISEICNHTSAYGDQQPKKTIELIRIRTGIATFMGRQEEPWQPIPRF